MTTPFIDKIIVGMELNAGALQRKSYNNYIIYNVATTQSEFYVQCVAYSQTSHLPLKIKPLR